MWCSASLGLCSTPTLSTYRRSQSKKRRTCQFVPCASRVHKPCRAWRRVQPPVPAHGTAAYKWKSPCQESRSEYRRFQVSASIISDDPSLRRFHRLEIKSLLIFYMAMHEILSLCLRPSPEGAETNSLAENTMRNWHRIASLHLEYVYGPSREY